MQQNTLTPFTITRSTWLRGEGPDRSYLLRKEDGKQCCLGQFAERICGVSRGHLNGLGNLSEVLIELPPAIKEWESSDHDEPVMALNDEPNISDAERERQLTEIFAGLGYAVTFED